MGSAPRFSFDSAEFTGKRALVTGGTDGIGAAILRRLVVSGATVATTARSPLPERQTVELFIQADISTREGANKVAEQVLQRFGGLDMLINVVGGSSAPSGGVLALTDDDWQKDINLTFSRQFVWTARSFPGCWSSDPESSFTFRQFSGACRCSKQRSPTRPPKPR